MLNLYKRKVMEKPFCLVCIDGVESVTHALWSCPTAQDIWSQCSIKLHKASHSEVLFLDVVENLCSCLEIELMEEIAVVSKGIWYRINMVVFQNEFKPPNMVVHQEKEDLLWMKEPQTKQQQNTSNTSIDRWIPPPRDFFKINRDAVVDKISSHVGIDIIVRDEKGWCLLQ